MNSARYGSVLPALAAEAPLEELGKRLVPAKERALLCSAP
jgi:hypothetical protein